MGNIQEHFSTRLKSVIFLCAFSSQHLLENEAEAHWLNILLQQVFFTINS